MFVCLNQILEDYFMMEEDTGEEPVVDKATEEDEIDLYINLTFTSGKSYWNSKSWPLWVE